MTRLAAPLPHQAPLNLDQIEAELRSRIRQARERQKYWKERERRRQDGTATVKYTRRQIDKGLAFDQGLETAYSTAMAHLRDLHR